MLSVDEVLELSDRREKEAQLETPRLLVIDSGLPAEEPVIEINMTRQGDDVQFNIS